MALEDYLQNLVDFRNRFESQISAIQQAQQSAVEKAKLLEEIRIKFIGKKSGELRQIQEGIRGLYKTDKPQAGQLLNQVIREIVERYDTVKQLVEFRANSIEFAGQELTFDPTVPGRPLTVGHLHPITQTIEHMKEIMGRLGFTAVEGPEIEDEWHNFEALNIPLSHPARDPLDNFYLQTAVAASGAAGSDGDAPLLLRSQTSTVQIRVMENTPPPVRIISLGRVYRPDTADATHYPMFHQIEGLLVDRHVTMADLKSVLRLFCQSYFGGEVHIRFRPSFFPFTEPSVEVDMNWQSGWIEMGGAGMVDPNVLRAVGYDPEQVTGFAFGLGVERICMRQHGISDIRALYENDVRFLHQF